MRQADHTSARRLADSSVAVARQVGDAELIAHTLRGAGVVYHSVGDLDVAARMYEEALSRLKGSHDLRLAIEVKNQLGVLATERGKYQEGLAILMDCVAFGRSETDEPSTARFLESLANAQFGLGDVDAAAASWKESLATFRGLNDAFGIIWCIGGLALVAAARLGTRKSESARNDGETMSTARALDYALGEDRQQAVAATDTGLLSRRERDVVALVAGGMTNREIAERLFIAERTAEGHLERIRNKLGVRSRTEVATWAVEHGILARGLDKKPPGSSV